MDLTTVWHEFRSLFGLNEPLVAQTLAIAFRALLVVLATFAIARWLDKRLPSAAKSGRASADVVSLLSRGAAFLIYGIGFTIILSMVGLNPTAIAAILGAATVGFSLATQDVARSFVNGVYILIERPFRIGDWIRVGPVEGRVEVIGVRLTRLRTEGGQWIIVPSTVVFTSTVEKSSVGSFDRPQYSISGIERPITEIEAAVVQALKGTQHVSQRKPVVAIVDSGPDGTTSNVTVEHDLGHVVDDQVISRLRAEFPETTVTSGTAVGNA